jgi:hypothetical protein
VLDGEPLFNIKDGANEALELPPNAAGDKMEMGAGVWGFDEDSASLDDAAKVEGDPSRASGSVPSVVRALICVKTAPRVTSKATGVVEGFIVVCRALGVIRPEWCLWTCRRRVVVLLSR